MLIIQAIETLDHSDDSQWTDNGLPLVEVIRTLTGEPAITRQQITDAAPNLVRGKEDESEESEEVVEEVVVDSRSWAEKVKEYQEELSELNEELPELEYRKKDIDIEIARSRKKIEDIGQLIVLGNEPPLNEVEARQAFMKRSTRSQAAVVARNAQLLAQAGVVKPAPAVRVPQHLMGKVQQPK